MTVRNGHTQIVQRVRSVLFVPTVIETVFNICFRALYTNKIQILILGFKIQVLL